jgi:hypothetical protein
MTTKTSTETVLATYRSRMAAIEARSVPHMNYVLSWGDGRYVGMAGLLDPIITGFENATFFGDRVAAAMWIKQGLTDGANKAPHIVNAFNAKQGAIITLQRAIDMVEAHAMLHIDNEAAAL